MTTGDRFTNIVSKRLMGVKSFKDGFLDYIKTCACSLASKVWTLDGTFGSNTVDLVATATADTFSLSISPDPNIGGTDGSGRLFDLNSTSLPLYGTTIYFENQTGQNYKVGLSYTEIPYGIRINPRTGLPQYDEFEEAIGMSDDPALVTDNGSNITFRLSDTLTPGNRDSAGRTCVVFRKSPAPGGTSVAVAIEYCTVVYSGGYNIITTTGLLGQDVVSEVEEDYTLVLLGPMVSRQTDFDPETADGYWFIGTITGNGPSAIPVGFSTTGQRLITKSLSTILDYLVYSNVENTFTDKQTFQGGSGDNEEAIEATGDGTGAGIVATGGSSNGDGIDATGVGTGSGVVGTGGASNGSGIWGNGTGAGVGVLGVGGSTNGVGVSGTAGGNGSGVDGSGGSGTGAGVFGIGGTGGGHGVRGTGASAGGNGGYFQGSYTGGTTTIGHGCYGKGASGKYGGYFVGGTGGSGIYGEAGITNGTTGVGGYFVGASGGNGAVCVGGTNAAAIRLVPRSGTPTSQNNGDIWIDTSPVGTQALRYRVGGSNYRVSAIAF